MTLILFRESRWWIEPAGRKKYHLQFLATEFSGNEVEWREVEAGMEQLRVRFPDELDESGLEVVPTNMPVEMLVVEKAAL